MDACPPLIASVGVQITIEQGARLILAAGEQMAVAVVRDRDRRVTPNVQTWSLGVSDGTRTRDHLDHNQMPGGQLTSHPARSSGSGRLRLAQFGAPFGASAERALNELWLLLTRLIVRVDQGGLEVAVPHPLLEGPQRDAGASHSRSKRVPQVVEAHFPDPRTTCRGLEALQQARPIERLAGLRVTED